MNKKSANFDKKEYKKEYQKEHYKRIVADYKPADYNLITDYCNDNGISRTAYILACCKYCIENNIDVM